MTERKIYTMSLNKSIKEEFDSYCEKHGMKPSKRIDVLMKRDMKNEKLDLSILDKPPQVKHVNLDEEQK